MLVFAINCAYLMWLDNHFISIIHLKCKLHDTKWAYSNINSHLRIFLL